MLSLARTGRYLKKGLIDAGASLRSHSRRNGLSFATEESRRKPFMSASLSVDDKRYFNFNIPGVENTESDERLCVFVNLPGVKKEDVTVCLENRKLLCIEGKKYEKSYRNGKVAKEIYNAFMELGENVQKSSCMITTEMMQDGMFKVTLPKVKDKELSKTNNNNIFTNIFNTLTSRLALRFFSIIPSCIFILTIARPLLIDLLCSNSNKSFTIYKKETAKSLHISLTPGLLTMDYVREGVCVSLNMPELRIEDVKPPFFKHDTLFIQGQAKTKTNKVQYITGIRLPVFCTRKPRRIREEMQDGVYKATIPAAT